MVSFWPLEPHFEMISIPSILPFRPSQPDAKRTTAGGAQICIFDEGRPGREIEAPKDTYFLTGRVVINLRWPKTHDKMRVQMLKCSKSHEKMMV